MNNSTPHPKPDSSLIKMNVRSDEIIPCSRNLKIDTPEDIGAPSYRNKNQTKSATSIVARIFGIILWMCCAQTTLGVGSRDTLCVFRCVPGCGRRKAASVLLQSLPRLTTAVCPTYSQYGLCFTAYLCSWYAHTGLVTRLRKYLGYMISHTGTVLGG